MEGALVLVWRWMGKCKVKGARLSWILQSTSGKFFFFIRKQRPSVYTSQHQEGFCQKAKAFLILGCGTWTPEYLTARKHVLCRYLTSTATSKFLFIPTWGKSFKHSAAVLLVTAHGKHSLVKWKPRQAWRCLCLNYLLAVDTGQSSLTNTLLLPCCGAYRSPWDHRSLWNNTIPLQSAVASTGLPN